MAREPLDPGGTLRAAGGLIVSAQPPPGLRSRNAWTADQVDTP